MPEVRRGRRATPLRQTRLVVQGHAMSEVRCRPLTERTAMLIAVLACLLAVLLAWRFLVTPGLEDWRGDCPWCDGRGDWSCKHCVAGYVPWCHLPDPDDPGETVCAKCMGDGTNSMGDQCPDCPNIIKS